MKTTPSTQASPLPDVAKPVTPAVGTRHVVTDNEETVEQVGYDFGMNRRSFVQWLSAGFMVAVSATPALAQRTGRGGNSGARTIAARIHLGKDGSITVLTGKVEGGQGARAELTQAAAEELLVPFQRIELIMADTEAVPDDGITAGSGTSPRTVRAVRQGAAAAREALLQFAAARWKIEPSQLEIREGQAVERSGTRTLSYADLANDPEAAKALEKPVAAEVVFIPIRDWKVMGHPAARPNGLGIVTGGHKFPSDISRPGMWYGKVLRAPGYGGKLTEIDLGPAKAIKDVVVTQDDQFVGVAAPSTFLAEGALEKIAETAKWELPPHPASQELFDYLRQHAQGGLPPNPFANDIAQAHKALKQTYHVAYVQHAPLEPRAAVAEWAEGKLTVWAGTQNPFGYRSELARAFHLAEDQVRVVVPDFGAAFGGKHTGEAAVEAARLAKAAGRPVCLRWTRQEEFTWAYFRPAALIEAEASLDAQGTLTSWHFLNVNSGGSAVETPYRVVRHKSQYIASTSPLRQGSYRALAATANNFARESFMDELAAATNQDPLQFRLAHLDNDRLKAVLEKAAERFQWKENVGKQNPNRGVGLACGTEKGSYVAACVEIEVQQPQKTIVVRRISQVFECGAIVNPENLLKQVQGAIVMGLGPALREEIRFENGKLSNASFRKYLVPRYADLPVLDIHLLNRPDLDPLGAGETPIIAVAPAIANAVFNATGVRVRQMPIRLG